MLPKESNLQIEISKLEKTYLIYEYKKGIVVPDIESIQKEVILNFQKYISTVIENSKTNDSEEKGVYKRQHILLEINKLFVFDEDMKQQNKTVLVNFIPELLNYDTCFNILKYTFKKFFGSEKSFYSHCDFVKIYATAINSIHSYE